MVTAEVAQTVKPDLFLDGFNVRHKAILIPVANVTVAEFIRVDLIAAGNQHNGEIFFLRQFQYRFDQRFGHRTDADEREFLALFVKPTGRLAHLADSDRIFHTYLSLINDLQVIGIRNLLNGGQTQPCRKFFDLSGVVTLDDRKVMLEAGAQDGVDQILGGDRLAV